MGRHLSLIQKRLPVCKQKFAPVRCRNLVGHNSIAAMVALQASRVIIALEAEIARDSTALLRQGYLHSSASQCWGAVRSNPYLEVRALSV
jgi:hypothetical protein